MQEVIPFDGIASLVTGIIDRVWPNPNETERARLEALKIAMTSELAIHETNKAEAAHPSIFVAGWRPFIGWAGGSGIVYQFVGQPLLAWLSLATNVPVPPQLDLSTLVGLVVTMLGMGGYRTYEGVKNVKRSTWKK